MVPPEGRRQEGGREREIGERGEEGQRETCCNQIPQETSPAGAYRVLGAVSTGNQPGPVEGLGFRV